MLSQICRSLFCAFALVVFGVSTSYAVVYEVGPGKTYASIGAVPWYSLGAGDTVRIHYSPTPYREIINISTRGNASSPINIVGVPGPNGEKPIIDGQNATISGNMRFAFPTGTPRRGVIVIGPQSGYSYGFKPGHINISGLVIRNGNKNFSFTDATGTLQTFRPNASSIFVERGENITISDCVLTGSGNGLFVASGGDEATQSRNILVQYSHIYNNGNSDSYLEHNVYTECIGVVFQYNHFGNTVSGSLGNVLKDRSAGTVIRYNWFESGQGGHIMDLVNPQEGAALEVVDPTFRQTYVYGNVIYNGPQPQGSTYMIHYGGDDGITSNYRKGTLYFYHNTVIVECDQSGTGSRWRTVLLRLETNDETADARNNIIFLKSATPGANPTGLSWLNTAGTLNLYANWVSPGVRNSSEGYTFIGTINGLSNLFVDPTNNPGFANYAGQDFHLLNGSPAINKAGPLAQAVFINPVGRNYDVTTEYVKHLSSQTRSTVGGVSDLGAFEFGLGSVPPTPTPTPTPVPTPIFTPTPIPTPIPTPVPTPKPTPVPTPTPTPTATPTPTPMPTPVPTPVVTTTTVSYQQGVNSYMGAKDCTITNLYTNYAWNYGEGVTFAGTGTLDIRNGSLSSGGMEARSLIKFTGITIPTGKTVASATLTVTFTNWHTPGTLIGYYLNTYWNPTSNATISWKRRDVALNWAAPGASGIGTDRIAGSYFSFSGFTMAGNQTKTVALDPAIVQSWLTDPTKNHGIILVNPNVGWRITAHSSQSSSINLRPKLTITYK
jgi:hypothetical protein